MAMWISYGGREGAMDCIPTPWPLLPLRFRFFLNSIAPNSGRIQFPYASSPTLTALDLKQGGRRRGANLSSIALIASYGRHGSQGGSCRCCGCTCQFFFPCCRFFQFTHYIQSCDCPGAIGMESTARQRAQVGSFGQARHGPHPLVVQEGQHHRNAGR
jgi:hypothetical protein